MKGKRIYEGPHSKGPVTWNTGPKYVRIGNIRETRQSCLLTIMIQYITFCYELPDVNPFRRGHKSINLMLRDIRKEGSLTWNNNYLDKLWVQARNMCSIGDVPTVPWEGTYKEIAESICMELREDMLYGPERECWYYPDHKGVWKRSNDMKWRRAADVVFKVLETHRLGVYGMKAALDKSTRRIVAKSIKERLVGQVLIELTKMECMRFAENIRDPQQRTLYGIGPKEPKVDMNVKRRLKFQREIVE